MQYEPRDEGELRALQRQAAPTLRARTSPLLAKALGLSHAALHCLGLRTAVRLAIHRPALTWTRRLLRDRCGVQS
ncbi:MAG: hypothetical protein OHK0048_15510 [Rhodoferax sp.]